MSAWMQNKERWRAMQRRRRPAAARILSLRFEARPPLIPEGIDAPSELHLEPTGPDGETALWLDDFFWLELIQRWPQKPLTIHYLPTPHGLLHPVVLHQLTMLRRVTPEWRLIGHCYRSDLAGESQQAQAALSLYHEIHIRNEARVGSSTAGLLSMEALLAKLSQLQAANRRTAPIIVAELVGETDEPSLALVDACEQVDPQPVG
jgi:hypothetical protein